LTMILSICFKTSWSIPLKSFDFCMNIVAPFYGSQKIKEAESIRLEKSLIIINYSDRIGRAVQEEDRFFYSSCL
jgi:hypothetical protein